MRFTNVQYLHQEEVSVSIRNQDTAAILDGYPVFYLNNDQITANNVTTPGSAFLGADVQLYSTVPAAQTSLKALFAGIAKVYKTTGLPPSGSNAYLVSQSLAVGDVGEAICYGFTDSIVTLRTRAASTLTWASAASQPAGVQLAPETVGNAFSPVASFASSVNIPEVVAAQSLASQTTAASTYGGTQLADTYRMKVFVRNL